ncbi:UNVERIFIED_CONTAM: hypothetical protein FKN15_057579 [Acipenser sinensis]
MVPGIYQACARAPETPYGVPTACQVDPGTSPARTLGPATPRGIPAAHKWSLVPPEHAHGHRRFHAGSHRLANWSLAPPQRAHRRQRMRAGSGQLAKWSLPLHITRTDPRDPAWGPSGSQNGPWHHPSERSVSSDRTQC